GFSGGQLEAVAPFGGGSLFQVQQHRQAEKKVQVPYSRPVLGCVVCNGSLAPQLERPVVLEQCKEVGEHVAQLPGGGKRRLAGVLAQEVGHRLAAIGEEGGLLGGQHRRPDGHQLPGGQLPADGAAQLQTAGGRLRVTGGDLLAGLPLQPELNAGHVLQGGAHQLTDIAHVQPHQTGSIDGKEEEEEVEGGNDGGELASPPGDDDDFPLTLMSAGV
ncbi:hypothetical protein TYRP_001667, partial [Tyrophagus putrescentiae]